jgi:mono/diheme cytochrome c family protein
MRRGGRRAGRGGRLASFAGAVLLAAGCGGGRPGASADGDPRRALYNRQCAACHGPDGRGGQVGQQRVPSLKEGRALAYTDRQLFEQISEGRGAMPPFKYTLTDEQINTLARFLREEIQGRKE